MILGKIFARYRGMGSLCLRLAVGVVFVYHGAHKVGILGEKGIQSAVDVAQMVGFSPPQFWGWALAVTELGGGLLLLLGLFTRYAAVALAFVMAVAAIKVHLPNGFDVRWGGLEFTMVLFAACVALLFQGGGTGSLDQRMSKAVKP